MAETLIIKQDTGSPNVTYNEEAHTLSIEGVCMPENAMIMFKPVFDTLNEVDKSNLKMELHLKYLNSMSSKQLLRMFFEVMEKFQSFSILWKHDSSDELMKMKGEELQMILNTDQFKIQSV